MKQLNGSRNKTKRSPRTAPLLNWIFIVKNAAESTNFSTLTLQIFLGVAKVAIRMCLVYSTRTFDTKL